jgi:hypothetical protein
MFLFLLVAALISPTLGANVLGLDVSQPVSRTVADCFVRNGYKYLLIRAWFCVNGGVDSNAITTYNNLRAAGMPHIGFYIFPCVGRASCASAASQVTSVKNFINTNNMKADSVWLDIEGGGSCPWGSVDANKQFYVDMLSAAKSAWPDRYGVYSSRYMWETLFGSRSWTNPGDDKIKLWYAHYDKIPDFSTFLTFSSWPTKSSPYAKQYDGNVNTCNFNVDLNAAPEFFGITNTGMSTPPPVITSCKFGGVNGVCSSTNDCAEPKQWVSSSAGATGCELLPNEIRCCVANSNAPATPCSFSGATGQCMATATCISSGKQSVPSANGAAGCEKLPADVRCCIDPKQTNNNQPTTTSSNNNNNNNGPATTSAQQPGGSTAPISFAPQVTTLQQSPRSLSIVVDSNVITSGVDSLSSSTATACVLAAAGAAAAAMQL